MKRIGFILKPDKSQTGVILDQLVPWLQREGHVAVVCDEDRIAREGVVIVPRAKIGEEIDIAVVLGGDGTILGATELVADAGVPILGINLGRLGFLAAFDPAEAEAALADAIAGRLRTSERMRLEVTHRPQRGEPVTRCALNDAVVHQGSMARLIELETRVDDDLVSVYRADGLIVCTPTGSTAHNLAAGGPIIMPGQTAMVLTSICAHSLTSRPLVVPETSVIRIELGGDSRGAVLTVDGQWALSFLAGDRVEIVAAPTPLVLFDSSKRYFDILREKLHWDAEASNRHAADPPPGPAAGRGETTDQT